jgi:hypothetical protein
VRLPARGIGTESWRLDIGHWATASGVQKKSKTRRRKKQKNDRPAVFLICFGMASLSACRQGEFKNSELTFLLLRFITIFFFWSAATQDGEWRLKKREQKQTTQKKANRAKKRPTDCLFGVFFVWRWFAGLGDCFIYIYFSFYVLFPIFFFTRVRGNPGQDGARKRAG